MPVGTVLTEWYTFESTTPDIQPLMFAGFHRGALREFVVKIGNFPAVGRGDNPGADNNINVMDSAFDVPEPGSFMLLGMGAMMCAKRLRRARRN